MANYSSTLRFAIDRISFLAPLLSFLETGPLPEFNGFHQGQPSYQGKWYHPSREIPETDEELSPSLENFVLFAWLRLPHHNLPRLVKQRYGTELRSRTLLSVKPEISQTLESLFHKLHASDESKITRTAYMNFGKRNPPMSSRRKPLSKPRKVKACPLCQQAGRSDYISTS